MHTDQTSPRVGFNAMLLSLTDDFRAAGIHRYIVALLRALSRTQGDDFEITAFASDPAARTVLPSNVRVRSAPGWAGGRIGRIVWEQTMLPLATRRMGGQLLHSAAYAIPVLPTVPAVVTVHDLSFFRMPETFPARQGAYLRTMTRHAVRHAAALIAVSEFTRDELVSLLGADPQRIHVVPNGCDPEMQRLPDDRVAAWRRDRGLPDDFILTLGTLQPRKNVGMLLEAYREMRAGWSGHRSAPELVVAGARGWGDEDAEQRARALGIVEHVHFTGFVPSDDLPWLYNAATLFALPSRYEGFGLPALEAMACGTPVAVADGSSLPEVVGDAGLVLPADQPRDWARALASLMEDDPRRSAMGRLGSTRAAGFTWDRTARDTAAVWRSVLASGEEVAASHVVDVGHTRDGLGGSSTVSRMDGHRRHAGTSGPGRGAIRL